VQGAVHVTYLSDRRHGICGEPFNQFWSLLQIGCENDSVFPQILRERVPGPSTHCFDDIKGGPTEKVMQRASDPKAVPFQKGKIMPRDDFPNSHGNLWFGEGP
jgi:hypothetical protein